MDPLWLTGLGTIVLAVATLILAGITFWSVKSNNEANRLLREETKQLHEKEKNRIGKLQSMENIINWANEVNNILGGKMFSLQSQSPLNALLDKTRDVTIDVNSVKTASILFDDSVQGLVGDCLNSYNLFKNSIFNLRDSYMKIKTNVVYDEEELKNKIISYRIELLNAITRLQRYIRELKVSLLS